LKNIFKKLENIENHFYTEKIELEVYTFNQTAYYVKLIGPFIF